MCIVFLNLGARISYSSLHLSTQKGKEPRVVRCSLQQGFANQLRIITNAFYVAMLTDRCASAFAFVLTQITTARFMTEPCFLAYFRLRFLQCAVA